MRWTLRRRGAVGALTALAALDATSPSATAASRIWRTCRRTWPTVPGASVRDQVGDRSGDGAGRDRPDRVVPEGGQDVPLEAGPFHDAGRVRRQIVRMGGPVLLGECPEPHRGAPGVDIAAGQLGGLHRRGEPLGVDPAVEHLDQLTAGGVAIARVPAELTVAAALLDACHNRTPLIRSRSCETSILPSVADPGVPLGRSAVPLTAAGVMAVRSGVATHAVPGERGDQ